MRLPILLPTLLLLALPAMARADHNPDFDDDAKPILRLQPGLLEYVEANFKVKDTGIAKYPGTDDRPPQPPYMFRAKPRGEAGPYHLMLLIQPGPMNHILNVVDMNRVHLEHPPQFVPDSTPAAISQPTMPPAANPSATGAPAASAPTPTSTQTLSTTQAPTADTPSGPIKTGSTNVTPTTAPSLAPPPDPAPTAH